MSYEDCEVHCRRRSFEKTVSPAADLRSGRALWRFLFRSCGRAAVLHQIQRGCVALPINQDTWKAGWERVFGRGTEATNTSIFAPRGKGDYFLMLCHFHSAQLFKLWLVSRLGHELSGAQWTDVILLCSFSQKKDLSTTCWFCIEILQYFWHVADKQNKETKLICV